MPEFIPGYNRGLSDFHAEHSWILNTVWQVPGPGQPEGIAGALLSNWRVAGIIRMRSGSPLTPMLQTNRSRSLWSPSLIAFAGTTDGEAPLASFGQIRTTTTSSRQIQVGIRMTF